MESGTPSPPKLDETRVDSGDGNNREPPPTASIRTNFDLNKPCKVVDISFDGARRTRPTLLAKIVADIFPAASLLDLVQRSALVTENLRSLNAFSSIETQLEPVSNDENQTDYRIVFVVQEKGRIVASAQTAVDQQSTYLNLELATPNMLGIGDSLKVIGRFTKRFYSGECRYTLPLAPWRLLWNPIYSIFYNQYQYDSQPSGYDQEDKAIVNQVEFFSLPQVHHSISFDNVWRHIKSSSPQVPIEIREQSSHSVKSSVKHCVTWDNRLGGNFPFAGVLAKLSNEFTTNLVNFGARFTRHEANVQLNALILPQYDLLFQLNVMAGTLIRPNKINICDKFFAGGPLTLRGFKFQGLEPNVRGHPLGDMSYLSAGIHLYSILPYTTTETPINDFIRPHIFVNSGTIGDINEIWRISSQNDLKRECIRFANSLRYSCGFGLVMYFMRLRLEVNYCLPLVFKENDMSMRGFQYGFGLHYT